MKFKLQIFVWRLSKETRLFWRYIDHQNMQIIDYLNLFMSLEDKSQQVELTMRSTLGGS